MTATTERPSADTLQTDPHLIAVMPLLYVAWSDGSLSSEEIGHIRGVVSKSEGFSEPQKSYLARWLDPASPPTPVELEKLLAMIRRGAGSLSPTERRTLARLGLEIAKLNHDPDDEAFRHGAVHDTLLELEKAFGIASEDAAHALLAKAPWPVNDRWDEPEASFDATKLCALIDGDHHDAWERVRKLLADPVFHLDYDESGTRIERDRVRKWLGVVADNGLGALAIPQAHGGQGDMHAFIASFEALAMFDLSLLVKFGVQFGLFGGSVINLGTAPLHARFLPALGRGELLGGFAMTELGHGSNVRDIETVARYDADRGLFILDTPTESARKEWIGNAAEDGRYMTVFAQLEVAGQRHGVHALLVRIRNDDGSPVAGVRTQDCGRKMGLNGVDNGRIWFSNVEVPRDQLLARFGDVTIEGAYQSEIASASKRFFTMLGTLVGGRISVAASANTAAKVALSIAVRYGAMRRQFGPPGAPETRILDYPEHQLRLLPRVAASLGFGFALQALNRRFTREHQGEDREVDTRAAALKALVTRHAIDSIQASRECCGGMGVLAQNRIAEIRRDIDVFATFEGDNTVLLQLVSKSLLTDSRQQLSDDLVATALRWVARRAATTLKHKNPIGARRTEREHLVDPAFHRDLFEQREETLLTSAARRINRRVAAGMDAFTAFNQIQDQLMALARAFGERIVVEAYADAVARAPEGPEKEVLGRLYALHCLVRIREDLAFFSENGFVEPSKARAIRKLVVELCGELRPDMLGIVEAFGLPDSCIAAPIAFDHYLGSEALGATPAAG